MSGRKVTASVIMILLVTVSLFRTRQFFKLRSVFFKILDLMDLQYDLKIGK